MTAMGSGPFGLPGWCNNEIAGHDFVLHNFLLKQDEKSCRIIRLMSPEPICARSRARMKKSARAKITFLVDFQKSSEIIRFWRHGSV